MKIDKCHPSWPEHADCSCPDCGQLSAHETSERCTVAGCQNLVLRPAFCEAHNAPYIPSAVPRSAVETTLSHYGYGIIEKDGKPYFDENCVSSVRSNMEDEVESLNDGGREDDFELVELLYRRESPNYNLPPWHLRKGKNGE